jgi:hypothetical protein
MPDSFFEYIDKPLYKSLKLTIYPLVFRTALGSLSLPVYLTLSQPAAKTLKVNVTTDTQDAFVDF